MRTPPVSAALASIVIAPPVPFENLVLFPLVLRDDEAPAVAGYRTLDDALSRAEVEITEISEQGSVPELRLVNRGSSPVLIVDGEELVGAKQNRVVNLTILVAAQSELKIPVSCVEAGRWRSKSRAFSSTSRAHFATGRAKRMAKVTESIATLGMRHSDQSEVWADIADKFAQLRTSSPTGAMEALFLQHASFIDDCVSACRPVDRQVGALFSVNNGIVGFDLFDSPHTLTALLPKLVRSVAVDALDQRDSRVFLTNHRRRQGNHHVRDRALSRRRRYLPGATSRRDWAWPRFAADGSGNHRRRAGQRRTCRALVGVCARVARRPDRAFLLGFR
jgi:hypothetical protein